MSILLMPATQMLAMTEGAGGLFDFNATLPLMAIQFILLSVVLTFVFYKPVSKVIDDREEYINGNLTTASEKLIKADELYSQYDEQLKTARVSAQAIIAQSEKEAKDVVAAEINEARKDASKLIERTNRELEDQKTLALEQLESQVDDLSQLIKEKLLGKEVVL
jgi:F-type H+-transporting ATPase subunit b